MIPALITDVPQIAVAGDSALELQNGTTLFGPEGKKYLETIAARNLPALLDYQSRRLSRKKVIASYSRVFACGGYPRGEPRLYHGETPKAVIVSAAGPQFEMDHLEWRDFVIDFGQAANPAPLFPHYYPHSGGAIPSCDDIIALHRRVAEAGKEGRPPATSEEKELAASYINVGNVSVFPKPGDKPPKPGTGPIFFNTRAYYESMRDDIFLILSAVARMVEELNATRPPNAPKKRGFFKFVAIGTGFFAQNPKFAGSSVAQLLYPLLLSALERVLNENRLPRDKQGPWIDTIELPDFSGRGVYTPAWGNAPIHGVSILKGGHRDVLEFTRDEFERFYCGALNAGDCFCIPGNERQYASVEAAVGNNTDIRIQQAYFHNPQLLNLSLYHPIQ